MNNRESEAMKQIYRMNTLLHDALILLNAERSSPGDEFLSIIREFCTQMRADAMSFYTCQKKTTAIYHSRQVIIWNKELPDVEYQMDVEHEVTDLRSSVPSWIQNAMGTPVQETLVTNDSNRTKPEKRIHNLLKVPVRKDETVHAWLKLDREGSDQAWTNEETEYAILFSALLYSGEQLREDNRKQEFRFCELLSRHQDIIEEQKMLSHQLKNSLAVIKINTGLINESMRHTDTESISCIPHRAKLDRIERAVDKCEVLLHSERPG